MNSEIGREKAMATASVREQVNDHLAQNGAFGGLFYFSLALLLAFSTPCYHELPLASALTLISLAVGSVARLLICRPLYKRLAANPERWRLIFVGVTCWLASSIALYLMKVMTVFGQNWVGFVAALLGTGIVAGGLTSLSSDSLVFRTFLISSMLPVSAAGIMQSGPGMRAIAGCYLLYSVYCLILGSTLSKQFLNLVRSRKELCRKSVEVEKSRNEAVQANRFKSEFLANMSHEIRTPMTGILGMTGLARETEDARERDRFLALSEQSAESLLGIINDILDLSKVEAGKLALDVENFEPRRVFPAAMQMVAHRAAPHDVELICDIDPEIPFVLVGDDKRLRQIAINLIGNAIKFTESGEVHLRLEGKTLPNHGYRLFGSVRDTGIGIAPERLGSIFGAFNQAENDTSRQYGGTGLGLTISNRLVEMMDGSIRVESEEGCGTTFFFTVDLQYAEDTNQNSLNLGHGRELALVMSNETARASLAADLQAVGFTCRQFAGQTEFEMHRSQDNIQSVASVLTDWQLPDGTGSELAAQLLADANWSQTPVIMLANQDQIAHQADPGLTNMEAQLLKPLAVPDVVESIEVALGDHDSAQSSHKTIESSEDMPALKILVAEDNVVNQTLLKNVMKKMGHEATIASDGEKAVLVWQEGRHDVILMDIQMPNMDGLEATMEIRRLEIEQGRTRTPIFALTADVLGSASTDCEKAGMDGYLSKPLKMEAVRAALASIAVENCVL